MLPARYDDDDIFIKPSTQRGRDTGTIFKGSFTGFEFRVFLHTGCHTKVKEPGCPTIYSLLEEKIVGRLFSPEAINVI